MNIYCNRKNMKSESERKNDDASDDGFMSNTKKQ